MNLATMVCKLEVQSKCAALERVVETAVELLVEGLITAGSRQVQLLGHCRQLPVWNRPVEQFLRRA